MEIRQRFNKEKLFWTSDTHWHHSNILEFCHRPWGDIKTHDVALIQNWNKVVPKDGIVFHLGDFLMTANIEWTKHLVSQLNGTIYLIPGNHDYRNRMDRPIIKELFGDRVHDILEIIVTDDNYSQGYTQFIMCHYPMMYWRRGRYHLHGHVHSGVNSTASERVPFHYLRYDVGVDNNNYTPISYPELMVIFEQQKEKQFLE